MKIFQSGDDNDKYFFFFCEGNQDDSLVRYMRPSGLIQKTTLDNFAFHKNDRIIMELNNEIE